MASKKIEDFELKIKYENVGRFIDLCNEIQRRIDIDEPVPAAVVCQFFDLFYNSENGIDPLTFDAKKISEKAVKRINRSQGYKFTYKKSVVPQFDKNCDGKLIKHPDFIIVDLQKLFYNSILSFLKFHEENPIITMQLSVRHFYNYLESSINEFDKKIQKRFTRYRKAVMTGILLEAVGFRISNKKLRSNHDIYQAMRYYLNNKN